MLIEGLLFVMGLIIIHHVINRMREPSGMPPGPTPLPIIGNLPSITGYLSKMHIGFSNLAKKYGEIFTFYMQGQRIILISSTEIAREALVQKRDDFAGRPYTFTIYKFSRGGKGLIFQDFSEIHVLQRKLAHAAIRLYGPRLEGKIMEETDEMIKRIRQRNNSAFNPRNDISLAVFNTICAIVFGERYDIDDPEFLRIVEDANNIGWIVGGILDVFPCLSYFPIPATKALRRFLESRDEVFDRKYREHLETYQDGVTRDFTDALLHAKNEESRCDGSVESLITQDHVIMTIQDVFLAGTETTSTTLLWMIACLVRYPEIQVKVRKEIDKKIGRHRKPELSDKENLPYLNACIAEVLRFVQALPMLAPHKATRDSNLHGYHIPKDTTVMVNAWALHHDENEWKNPHEFDPTRFITSDGKCDTTRPSYMPFGAGRRVCIGESMAKKSMFIMAARMLQEFEFTAPDNDPALIPRLEGNLGIIYSPLPFDVCAVNRL